MAAAPTRDAIEVRESIEAKGDVDDDVEMEDADANDDDKRKAADKDQDADMADDREDDDEEDEDEDEDEEESDSAKDLLQLIRDTSEYLCRYTIKVDGESVTLCPPASRYSCCASRPIGTLTSFSVGTTRLPLDSRG